MHSQTTEAYRSDMMKADVMQLAVCGLHMRGLPLEHQLTSLGASFNRACKSSPTYRLYAITDPKTKVCKPGMIAYGRKEGAAIDLEIWNVPVAAVGSFLLQIPEPLGLGTVRLDSDESVKGFICEGYIATLCRPDAKGNEPPGIFDVQDITEYGSWKAFVAQQSEQS